jgi:hypothetical protein
MALEHKLPSNDWELAWSEWDHYPESTLLRGRPFWVEMDAYGSYNIMVSISHWDFEHYTQLTYQKVMKTIDVEMRVVLQDTKGNMIPSMFDTFVLTINDNDKVSECEQATVDLKTKVETEF